jgi:hypothetical protein
LRASGFQDLRLEYLSPVPETDRLRALARPPGDADPLLVDAIDTVNEAFGKLNARLFTFMDYAAIGRK